LRDREEQLKQERIAVSTDDDTAHSELKVCVDSIDWNGVFMQIL
jgi:hypothetical protein